MNIDKQAFMRAARKCLHKDLIRGFDSIEPLGSSLDVGIRHRYSIAIKYQILHMFFNAGVSKKTLMVTHHRRFSGKNKACIWCLSYLRAKAHRLYAERRYNELRCIRIK